MAEIVGLVASVLGPTIELGKCIVEPIKRQFNYLCCFNSNIQSLRDEAKKLDDARVGLQMQVDEAKRNTHVVVPQVLTWLQNVNAIQAAMSGIESQIPNVTSRLLAIKSRFSLSRKAKKMAEAMKELQDHRKFDHISQPALPAAMGSITLGQTYEIESRKHIEEDIMTTLREEKVNMMGICGMGGVGKTTMAKKIMNRVREEHIFDEIVMAVVSQQVDVSKIQQEIAESLGLRFGVESLSARAHQLRARLMDTKRILIILDDLWEKLILEDLGIPHESDSKGRTILLTSRNRGVFNAMSVEKIFEMQTLSAREAWSLFREKIGTCADDQNLFSIAQEITKECKGLPIALVTVGVALKNKRNKSLWEDALQQLKSSNPIDMPYFLTEVYNPLKLSYDFLDSEHARSIFLLCCLFPEDDEISHYSLTLYGWGLGLFEGIRSLGDARNRVYTLVELLKSRSLLLEGFNEYRVKMHDIVRDVAIFIASKEGMIEPNLSLMTWPQEQSQSNCTWISPCHLGERTELPTGLVFPNLRLLLIENSRKKEFHLNDNFFEGTRELNVLSIRYYSLRSLPHTTQLLKNLRTLLLYSCENLETISVIGELVNLEILICRECHSVEELPVETGRLNRLRLLELTSCRQLKTIVPGIISSLVRLENLSMIASFSEWEGENKRNENKNARLSELELLLNLTSLEIHIEDSSLAAQQIHLSPNLVEFNIHIGKWPCSYRQEINVKTRIRLVLEREISLGDWIHKLLRRTEGLCLEGEGSSNLVQLLSEFQNLRSLQLMNFSMVERENVTALVDGRCGTTAVFPLLQFIWIQEVANLEEIYNGPNFFSSFKNLKKLRLLRLPALKHLWKSPYQNVVSLCCNLSSIEIKRCDSIQNLFTLAIANDFLLQLERLEIWSCEMMEQVFLWNGDTNEKDIIGQSSRNHRHITFPKLKILDLFNLPRLTTFCQGIESIEFPLLTQMEIGACPNLKSLVSAATSSSSGGINHDDDDDDNDSLHLFCKPKVAFGRLKKLKISGYERITSNTLLWCRLVPIDFFTGLEELEISYCGKIRSLFSSSIAQNLVNLKLLGLEMCREMVKVIEDEDDDCESETKRSVFLNLEILILRELSKLKSFCEWRCGLELPSLKEVTISKCSQMERFTLGSLTIPNLESIKIDGVDINTRDLNGALQPQRLVLPRVNIWPPVP